MSVINQMLNDLEKRREPIAPQSMDDNLSSDAARSVMKASSSNKRIWVLLFIFICLLGFAVWFLFLKPTKVVKTNVTVKSVVPAVKVTDMRKVESVIVKPIKKALPVKAQSDTNKKPYLAENAVLQYINIDVKGNKTVLHFMLDHRIHYQLSAAKDHQALILTLDNTSMKESLPVIENNPIIKDLQLQKQTNGDLVLSIQVVDGTDVRGLNLTDEVPIELVLTLSNDKISGVVGDGKVEMKTSIVPLTPEEQAEEDYGVALELLDGDNADAAMNKLKEILYALPSYQPARKTLVSLLVSQKRYDIANKYLQAGLKRSPNSVHYITLRARILLEQNQPKMAVRILQRVSPSLSEHLNYYALMAVAMQRAGSPLLAAQIYEQLLQYQSNNSIWWIGLGVALESSGKRNASLHAFEQAQSKKFSRTQI